MEVRVASPLDHPGQMPLGRVGFVVPKAGHGSVQRNLLKRWLKELCRRELLPRLTGHEIVIIARRESYAQRFTELRAIIAQLCSRLGLVADTQ